MQERIIGTVHRVNGPVIEAGGVTVPPFLPPQVALLELRARVRAALDPTGTLAYGPEWEREA